MNRLLSLIMIIICVTSCRFSSEDKTLETSDYQHIDSLRISVIARGDTAAMSQLDSFYSSRGNKRELVLYYMILADKYANKKACFHVYDILSKDSIETDSLSRYAIEYLEKGVERGDSNCINVWSRKYLVK